MKSQNFQKILLVRNDNIGDVICTTPCFELLRQRFPKTYIALLVCSLTYEAVKGNPFIDRIFVYEKAKHVKKNCFLAWLNQWRVLREIRQEKFDLAINLRPDFSPSAARIVWATGAKYRAGTPPVLKKHQKWKFLYNYLLPLPPNRNMHEVERTNFLLSTLGISSHAIPKVYFPISSKVISQAQNFFFKYNLPLHKSICLHLSGRKEANRCWPIDYWVQLHRILEEKKLPVFFTYAPSDKETFEKLCAFLNKTPPHFSSPSLTSFGAILNQARIFVGVDGGAMHIAAGVGTPCVIIFSKTSIKRWHPWGVKHICLQAEDKQVNSIFPDQVARAIEELL